MALLIQLRQYCPRAANCRRGAVLLYAIVAMGFMLALMILAVDYARISVAKSELQATADAAARYAVSGMAKSSSKVSTATRHATAICSETKVDGRTPTITAGNIQTGVWDDATKTFTTSTNNATINAVRVTVSQTIGGAGSAPLFANIFGFAPKTVQATAISKANMFYNEVVAPSQGNLWLAGMPDNTQITNLQGNTARYDNSGTSSNKKQRPQEISLSSLGVQAGDLISFEGLSGTGSNGGGAGNTGPDGNLSRMVTLGNSSATSAGTASVNGISNARAPLAAVMAVFLTNSAPNTTAAPSNLDFGTNVLRDYTQIAPSVKQVFFVGDGKTSTGQVQYIKVPPGATRVFLGMMDAWQWNDNTGSFNIKFYKRTEVVTVK